jgi:hypothetical protein
VRGTILGISIALSAVACQPGRATAPPDPDGGLLVQPSPSPYQRVLAGPVQAMVPDGWEAASLDPAIDYRGGFVAAPKLEGWESLDGSAAGMAATWVDATRVGVPSDYYYFAASGPLLAKLTRSESCQAEYPRVYIDRRPAFVGADPSPGDYMARGSGTCSVGERRPMRWAYFIAAPGFGPVRQLGIPSSGLYVVVAVIRDSRQARSTLRHIVRQATFGDTTVGELLAAARRANVA